MTINKTKIDLTILISLYLIVVVLLGQFIHLYTQWNQDYTFHFQNVIRIDPREIPVTHRTIKEAEAKEPTIEDYICSKAWDCNTALAVAKAESGMRCDAQNVNKGTNSVDVGLMQVNSVHLKKGWKIAELLDCKRNVDLAFEVYQGSGWQAWSTYNNKSYLKHK